MNFKIDTNRKVITIIDKVNWKELKEFMDKMVEPPSDEWVIETEIAINTTQSIPYDPVFGGHLIFDTNKVYSWKNE